MEVSMCDENKAGCVGGVGEQATGEPVVRSDQHDDQEGWDTTPDYRDDSQEVSRLFSHSAR